MAILVVEDDAQNGVDHRQRLGAAVPGRAHGRVSPLAIDLEDEERE
jgi:hypothetical protein